MKTIKTSAMSLMMVLFTSATLLAQNETANLNENIPMATTTTSYQPTIQPHTNPARKSFAVGMYRIRESLTMRLMVEKQAGERVLVRLLNEQGQIIHREVVGKPAKKYACNFDFSNTEDGQYTIEVTNGMEVITKAIDLTTTQVVETPARTLLAQN
jgi:hypothetical protein